MVKVIGFTRIRNESLILQEFLDHLSTFCDGIYVLDDASTDGSAEIAEAHPKVRLVIREKKWNPGPNQDGRQRGIIFRAAAEAEKPDTKTWFCCLDADERFDSMSRQRLEKINDTGALCVCMKLFDFYITPEDVGREYTGRLRELREWCGPEYRIVFPLFRWNQQLRYENREMRQPDGINYEQELGWGNVLHYGRAISVEEHQENCDFYIRHFPLTTSYLYEWMKKFPVTRISRRGKLLVCWKDVVGNCAKIIPDREFTSLSQSWHYL